MHRNSAVMIPVIEYRMIMATAVLGEGPSGFWPLLVLLLDDVPLPLIVSLDSSPAYAVSVPATAASISFELSRLFIVKTLA